jgi:WD40-like Beta Propeller Repeat
VKFLLNIRPFLLLLIASLFGCNSGPQGSVSETGTLPAIDPDYSGVTIPYNIAPLNFRIVHKASSYYVRISAGSGKEIGIRSKNGVVRIPEKKWKKLLEGNKGLDLNIKVFSKDRKGTWNRYKTITDRIAKEPIDPYITFRLLYPGYESWKEILIRQRELGSFRERSIIENSVVDENCINCHSYNNNDDSKGFLFHVRGSLGGTYFYAGNNNLKKFNLKTREMKNGAVYPRWHPSDKFVAFSSNKIVQQFHSALLKKVEVSDLESSLVLYDIDRNEMMAVNLAGSGKYMDTWPEWSPDGKYLYFCRAPEPGQVFEYDSVRYDLYRVPFDPSDRKFGEAEMVFNASAIKKSVSFPRISPDGNYMVITLHNYGCFPIWHKEADLWSIDLKTMLATQMGLNSDCTDSYHSWSSNSRWLVFSSKRIDGLTARFFISYISGDGTSSKPFILPQKDPGFYQRYLKSFNLPELSRLKVDIDPGKIRRVAKGKALQAKWTEN